MMTLAKALRVKNLLVGKLVKTEQDIALYNSIVAGGERPVDVEGKAVLRGEILRTLLGLKAAISTANIPIQRDILLISELKSSLKFYGGISTLHGKVEKRRSYLSESEPVAEYDAHFQKASIDTFIASINKEISDTQEKIDAYNHATTIDIEIPDELIY